MLCRQSLQRQNLDRVEGLYNKVNQTNGQLVCWSLGGWENRNVWKSHTRAAGLRKIIVDSLIGDCTAGKKIKHFIAGKLDSEV